MPSAGGEMVDGSGMEDTAASREWDRVVRSAGRAVTVAAITGFMSKAG